MVHRDLKPEQRDAHPQGDDPHYVKVLDFGLVKVVGHDATADLTRSGIVLGSPRYMAPEQVETRSVDHRADIYAFGAVLYHMLAGEPPFVYPSQFETLRAQVDEPPPPLEAKNPYCEAGPELRGLVFQCLDKRPEARPQTMADVAVRLKSCAMEVGISIPSISGVDIGLLAARAEARVPPPLEERVSAPPATMAAKPSARSKQESPEPEARPTVPDSPPAPEPPATPERRRSWLIPAILVALVGIGVAAAAFVIPMGGSEEPAAESTPAPALEPPPAPEPAPAATTVQLDSEPSGARVHHGDVDLGDAPVGLPIPAGERWELTLSLPGYEPRTIMVAAGQPSAHVRLTPQAAPQPEPEPDTPRRGQRHRPQGDSDEHNDLRESLGPMNQHLRLAGRLPHIVCVALALVALALVAFASGSASAQPADRRARQLYRRGTSYYDEGRYEEAVQAFQESYRLSGRPLLLFNIANAFERLGRYDQALSTLRRYAVSARESEQEQIRARIAALEERVAEQQREEEERQRAEAPPPEPEPAPQPPPQVAPPPPSPPPGPSFDEGLVYGGIAIGGVGVALLVAGAVMGALALDARSQAQGGCMAGTDGVTLCDESVSGALSQDTLYSALADTGFAVGGAAAIAGVVLAIIGAVSGGGSNDAASARVVPYAAPRAQGGVLGVVVTY